jgi:hypothetical protein
MQNERHKHIEYIPAYLVIPLKFLNFLNIDGLVERYYCDMIEVLGKNAVTNQQIRAIWSSVLYRVSRV